MIEKIITVNVKAVGDTKALKVIADLKKGMSELTDETEDFKKEQKDAQKTTQKVVSKSTDEISKQTKAVKKSADEQKNLAGVTGLADKATGGLFSRLKGLRGGLRTVTTGFKSLRVAIISSGVGALAVGVLAVVQAFKRSEEGQNKFAKIMGVIGAVTGQFLDVLADVGEYIISAFTNPQKAISDFANLIETTVLNVLIGLTELVPQLGKAIDLLFKFKFSEAAEVATNAIAKVVLGVDNVTGKLGDATDKVKEFSKETSKEADIAANIADQRAKADKLERGLIVQRAKANRKIADLREKAENREKFSAAERIVFLKEAAKLDDDITAREIQNARLRFNAKKQENELGKSTKEDKKEEAELLVNLINLETTLFTKKKALTAKEQALIREDATFKKGIEDEKAEVKKEREDEKAQAKKEREDKKEEQDKKQIAAEKAKNNVLKEIRKVLADTIREQRELELSEADEYYADLISKAEKHNIDTAELEQTRTDFLKNLRQRFKDADAADAADKADAEAEAATKKSEKAAADAAAEEKEEQERRARRDKTFDHAVSLVGAETRLGKVLLAAKKLIQAQEFVMDAIDEVREAKAIAKKAKNAVTNVSIKAAETGVETKASIGKAVNAAPPPFNIPFILSAVGTAVGVVSAVKAAVSATKSAAAAAGGGGGGVSTPSAPKLPPSRPPSFNIVGASGTNQLADVINTRSGEQTSAIEGSINSQTQVIQEGQEGQTAPIKAYVVSDEVTSMQGLERNVQEETGL